MACELQKVAVGIALATAVASTPSVAFGVVAPPAEPLLLAKMWLSWFGVVVALGMLAKCLDDADQHQDAESLRREIDRINREIDEMKHRYAP